MVKSIQKRTIATGNNANGVAEEPVQVDVYKSILITLL